jgi:hypothetical protein
MAPPGQVCDEAISTTTWGHCTAPNAVRCKCCGSQPWHLRSRQGKCDKVTAFCNFALGREKFLAPFLFPKE